MTARRGLRGCVASAGAVLLVAGGLGGCGSDSDDPSALCTPANDYVWYVDYFVGAAGGPPSAEEIPDAVDAMVDLSGDLADEVPSERQEEADTAHETWTGAEKVLDRYDLSDDSTADQAVADLQAELGQYQDSNDRYVSWLRDECGFDTSGDLSRPDGA